MWRSGLSPKFKQGRSHRPRGRRVARPAQAARRHQGMPFGWIGWTIASRCSPFQISNRAPVASRKPQHELARAFTLCALPVNKKCKHSPWVGIDCCYQYVQVPHCKTISNNHTQNTRLINIWIALQSKRVQNPFNILSNNMTQKKIISTNEFSEERIFIFRLCLSDKNK